MSVTESEWSVDHMFIEAVLRRAEAEPALRVTSLAVEDAVGKGENYASVLVRVAVEYTTPRGAATRSLLVKTPPRGELMQNLVRRTQFFEKETHMYATTLPAMRALLPQAGVDALAPAVLPSDRADTIVLADLRPDGFKMADRRRGLDLEHSTVAVRALAAFHAASWALHDADPASMDAFPETFYCEANHRMLVNHVEGMFTNLAEEVATWPGFERYAPKLRALAPCAVERAIAVVRSRAGDLRVLNHGDFWTNNMMFGYDAHGRVDRFRMLDFQMARWASPALDLHYFLSTSPRQAVLEAHRATLVAEYHAALADALRRFGVDAVVSLAQVEAELDAKLFYGLISSVMLAIMVADEEEVPDLSVLTEADADSTTSTSSLNKSRAGKIFRETFQRRLPWFEERGVFDQDTS